MINITHSQSSVATASRLVRAGLAVSLTSVLALSAAMAQQADADAPADAEAIVVTGSRLSTGFIAPTPVTTVGTLEIEQRASTNLGEVLAQLPSFRNSNSFNSAGVTSRNGSQITPDLRGLGSSRTLVLVNGRRHVPSETTGSVDIKLIPTLMVQQVEVVTGGASAAYGSDAVAGVVNFILKDNIDGIELTAQSGISQVGDGEEFRLSGAAGTSFGGGRGKINFGIDWLKVGEIGPQTTRDWGRRDVGLITNPNFATNGLPNYIIADNVHSANTTPGGLIVSGPLRGIQFTPGGGFSNYNFGTVYGATMIGGDGAGQNENLLANLGVPVESVNAMLAGSYELTNDLEMFAEFTGSWSSTGGASQENRDRGNLVIRRDNAYLPQGVRDLMIANNLQTVTIGRVSNDIGKITMDRVNKLFRGVVGLKGKIGDNWSWDAYYQYGRNDFKLDFGPNMRRQAEWLLAVDAVRDGSNNVVCRSTLTTPGNGCIPVNVFGDGSLVRNDYVFGTAQFQSINDQHVAAANIQGTPFSTWAGPVSIGVGYEYRADKATGTSDPLAQRINPQGTRGGWILGNQLPFDGKITVSEFYGEALVPLATDMAFARELNVTGAVRRTKYSTSGAVTTWKVGGTWVPVEGLRLRATRSRDIRAPNFAELFEAGGSSNTNVFDPVRGFAVQVRELNQGNLDLRPEKADTLTIGGVLQPGFMPGFALSVDYYKIKINDVITTLGAPVLTQGCFAGNALFCESITFAADGTIDFVTNTRLNLASFNTSGVDAEFRYNFKPSFMAGDIRMRLLVTYVDELTQVQQTGPQVRVGQMSEFNRVNGMPRWSGNADIGYDTGVWAVNLQARYIGSGFYSTLLTEGTGAANTVSNNKVPAYVYLTLGGHINVPFGDDGNVQFFGLINNLLDKDPAMVPAGAAGGIRESSTNASFYDVIGRYFRIGARLKF
ncbi:TonB-dependent receptor plug domain-containing protein [Polymorphobacter sp.]|uniref:TonB-dependent receptor plug domain-containing protein n=1 Tax=Polymorphobacter sp. TaxID=1909290 RepID=UPI003F7176DC